MATGATPAASDASGQRPDPAERLKRPSSLVVFWDEDELVVENYLSGRQSSISPALIRILDRATDWIERSELEGELAHVPDAPELLDGLVARDLLVGEHSTLARRDLHVHRSWRWGHDARWFHYATQRTRFEGELAAEAEELGRRAREIPVPDPTKELEGRDVGLPVSEPEGPLWATLRQRRTRRSFGHEPLTPPELGTLLHWTWGPTAWMRDPELGPYLLKTSPSGGARHPIEVYPLVLNVEGIEPALYHYSVRRNALIRLGDQLDAADTVRLCGSQSWAADAAAIFFMTAVLERTMWKYPASHAYRVVQLDAGHLGQTFHLVCTALGLAPFTTAAMDAPGIEQALGLDGVDEIAVYVAMTGRPERLQRPSGRLDRGGGIGYA